MSEVLDATAGGGNAISRAKKRRQKDLVSAEKSNSKLIALLVREHLAGDTQFQSLLAQEKGLKGKIHRNRGKGSKSMSSAIDRLRHLVKLGDRLDEIRRAEVSLSDSLHDVRHQISDAYVDTTRDVVSALTAAGRLGYRVSRSALSSVQTATEEESTEAR